MRIAIVGSRDYPRLQQVRDYVDTLAADDVIVSGGAKGVDLVAAQWADHRGLTTEIYPAEWDRLGKSAGFVRNQSIVDAADRVVAFWDGQSRGTMDTVRRALKAGKPALVISPLSPTAFPTP